MYVCVSILHDTSAPVYLWSCRGHVAARLLSLEHVHSSLLVLGHFKLYLIYFRNPIKLPANICVEHDL